MTEDNDFIRMISELQRKIEYDEEEIYSKVVIREFSNPNNFGILENPDAFGKIKGPCGDTMKISLKIDKLKIKQAFFWTDGCGASIACGSMLTKIIKDKNLKEANNISNLQLLEALQGLPIEHHHCTILAIKTLQKAIKNYNKKNLSFNK